MNSNAAVAYSATVVGRTDPDERLKEVAAEWTEAQHEPYTRMRGAEILGGP